MFKGMADPSRYGKSINETNNYYKVTPSGRTSFFNLQSECAYAYRTALHKKDSVEDFIKSIKEVGQKMFIWLQTLRKCKSFLVLAEGSECVII